MSHELKTIQDVRLMVGMGHCANGDPLLRLWKTHRNGKREGKPGPLEKHYGKDSARSTPEYINESNLDLSFGQFSADKLGEINQDITHRTDAPRDLTCPVVPVKFGNNYHLIGGARRLRHWNSTGEDGPHEVCILIIKQRKQK